jgi:hypothetical protein
MKSAGGVNHAAEKIDRRASGRCRRFAAGGKKTAMACALVLIMPFVGACLLDTGLRRCGAPRPVDQARAQLPTVQRLDCQDSRWRWPPETFYERPRGAEPCPSCAGTDTEVPVVSR